MNPTRESGFGSIYASGIWVALVHYAILDGNRQFFVRVCDGELDLISPPVPAHDMHIELGDGSRHPFSLSGGNPTTGMYLIRQ